MCCGKKSTLRFPIVAKVKFFLCALPVAVQHYVTDANGHERDG
jgi:hypothetical protein